MGDIKTDVSVLESHVFGVASRALEQFREFLPFAAGLTHERQIVLIEYQGEEEFPDPHDVVNYLTKKLQFGAGSGKYVATAMVFDSRAVPPGGNHKMETIAINLDHCQRYSMVRLTPYQLRSGKLGFGPTFNQEGSYLIFPLRDKKSKSAKSA
ncbi:MAG: hypothetical protein OEZ68_20580 [Gammaproteobacteria bacterium]|nr:hypothetical protein [Gammaproteobacteria bacterium]MDH5803201.1 hypothetical protein [Gammaproteobacteria bacterium]